MKYILLFLIIGFCSCKSVPKQSTLEYKAGDTIYLTVERQADKILSKVRCNGKEKEAEFVATLSQLKKLHPKQVDIYLGNENMHIDEAGQEKLFDEIQRQFNSDKIVESNSGYIFGSVTGAIAKNKVQ